MNPNKKGKCKGGINELQDFVQNILASAGIKSPEAEPQEEDGDCFECDGGFVDASGQWHGWAENCNVTIQPAEAADAQQNCVH